MYSSWSELGDYANNLYAGGGKRKYLFPKNQHPDSRSKLIVVVKTDTKITIEEDGVVYATLPSGTWLQAYCGNNYASHFTYEEIRELFDEYTDSDIDYFLTCYGINLMDNLKE
jgi:hypothetical protein